MRRKERKAANIKLLVTERNTRLIRPLVSKPSVVSLLVYSSVDFQNCRVFSRLVLQLPTSSPPPSPPLFTFSRRRLFSILVFSLHPGPLRPPRPPRPAFLCNTMVGGSGGRGGGGGAGGVEGKELHSHTHGCHICNHELSFYKLP